MAHGTPDWGVTAGAVTTYQVTDLGELAVRLGSPISHDRRGDVIWWDDFECTLNKWQATLFSADASATLSDVRARNGRYSALLISGSDVVDFAEIRHHSPYPALSHMGFEYSFHNLTSIGDLTLLCIVFDGVNATWFRVKWDNVLNTLSYFNSAGVWVSLDASLNLIATTGYFHTWKLVFDAAAGRFVRLLLDDVTYSLAGIAGYSFADASTPQLMASAIVGYRAGGSSSVYVDDAIITQNEPANP